MNQQQLHLFVVTPAPPKTIPQMEPPLSHAADPSTSYQAAERFARSGKLGHHHQLVLDGVRRCPGGTHMEIAAVIPELSWLQVVRRLSELQKAGLIQKGEPRTCTIKSSKCSTWWIMEGL